jgi:hypothetical protein
MGALELGYEVVEGGLLRRIKRLPDGDDVRVGSRLGQAPAKAGGQKAGHCPASGHY